MVYLFNSLSTNRLVYCLVFTTFTLNSVSQLHSNEHYFGFDDAWVLMKITNLVENLKSNKTNSNGMINTFVDILNEGKNAYGLRFDLDGSLNQVMKQIESQNIPIPKERFSTIRDRIQRRMRYVKCELDYLDTMKDIEGFDLNDLALYRRPPENEKNPNRVDQDDLPPNLVWGVCISLTGIALMAIPIPACRQWGGTLFITGTTICGDAICKEIVDKKKDDDDDRTK